MESYNKRFPNHKAPFISLFFSINEIQYNSIGYNLRFEVGECFNDEDLRRWLNLLENNNDELFRKIIKDKEPAKVIELWQQCKGHNDQLLEAIHSYCGCQIEETLWQKI